jgi:hypothetical protein
MGLLLLRRLPQLTRLRLEQWTNTASDVSGGSAVCAQIVCLFILYNCVSV